MPSVLSIESINLNGSILTAQDHRLYIDGMQVKNTSGIQLTDRYFLRGYAPISFYSRWPIVGNYLNEIYMSDFFMATGFLVTCSHPATGDDKLEGSFYTRKPESVIDTKYVGAFTLGKYQYSNNGSLDYKITPHNILGLNIHSTANEMRSLSISLLGYYSAAASFDKIPVAFNYYNNNIQIKENLYEQYIQYPAEFTGWGLYCGNSGAGPTTFTNYITGYISGFLERQRSFLFNGGSGYIINNNAKYFSNTNFSGFNGEPGFDQNVGYSFTGFNINALTGSANTDNFGPAVYTQAIGSRNIYKLDNVITGFLSGYRSSTNIFYPLSSFKFRINGFPTGRNGFIIDSSGYFLSGNQYYFPTGSGLFSGFSGMPGFQNVNYIYSGIFSNTSQNQFSGLYQDVSGGYTGYLYGPIGVREELRGEIISGFLEVEVLPNFRPIHTGAGYPPNTAGFSGYFLYPYEQRRFVTGGGGTYQFEAFESENGFIKQYGYEYSGFFPAKSGFSGVQFSNSGFGIMTGLIGYRNLPDFSPLTGKFYKKNKNGTKEYLIDFGITSGMMYAETDVNSKISFEVTAGDRVGIDVLKTLSGISDVNIVLGGFYK